MRLVCLASVLPSSDLASWDVVTLLDCGGSCEPPSGSGASESVDSGFGATIGRGPSSDEDCASAVVFAQNKRPKTIAAQALRLREKPWRKPRSLPWVRFEPAT